MSKCALHDALAAEIACKIINETDDAADACCVLESVIVVVLGLGLGANPGNRLAVDLLDAMTQSAIERLG